MLGYWNYEQSFSNILTILIALKIYGEKNLLFFTDFWKGKSLVILSTVIRKFCVFFAKEIIQILVHAKPC